MDLYLQQGQGYMHRRMHQLSPSSCKIYVCLQTHWNQADILWDQDVDLCRTRCGFYRLVLWTCQGVVVPRNAFASNQKDRPSEYFQEKLPSLCPYLEDCKSKDTPRVNQSLPSKWWLEIHPAIGWNVCWCKPFGDHAPFKRLHHSCAIVYVYL